MIQVKCKECGKPMLIGSLTDRRKFCSRQCFLLDRQRAYMVMDDEGVVMPPLQEICDEGFLNLTQAIIAQAKADVMDNAPGTMLREDAEAFFLSEEFYGLTNLDGFDMLCRIQDKYEEKQQKKNNYTTCKVRCVESGKVYDSIKEAAKAVGTTAKNIYNVLMGHGKSAARLHWERVEEEADE